MVKVRKAPHPKDLISGRELGSYMNAKDDYGIHLPEFVYPLFQAYQVLCNMHVHKDEANTIEAVRFVISITRGLLDEVEMLLAVKDLGGQERKVCDDN